MERRDSKAFSMYRAEKRSKTNERDVYNIYKEETLVAEVRGLDPDSQQVISMHELNDYEESKLHEYIGHLKDLQQS